MSEPLLESAFAHMGDPAWLETHGLFVAEGRHVTRRLLQSTRFRIVAVLLTPAAYAAMADVIGDVTSGQRPPVLLRTQTELDAITGFRLHQGCVAMAERAPMDVALPASLPGPVVALDRVRDPDNVGSIIRTAAGLGAGGLLLGPECADPFYRKAVRTSMGAVFELPLATASVWPQALNGLKEQGRVLIATTPDARAVPLAGAAALVRGRPIVLMMGSEGDGLSEDARALADLEVRIPMAERADSLNVAVATAVALYGLMNGPLGGTH